MNLTNTLRAVREEHGQLSAVLLVSVASDPAHSLHNRFTWDDSEAGHRYRLIEAGRLLRIARIPYEPTRPAGLRAFVAVKGKDTPRSDYVPVETAMANEFTRRLVLAQMEREWKTLKRRYQHMAEFADLIAGDFVELQDRTG